MSRAEQVRAEEVREEAPPLPRNPLWTLGILRSELTTTLRRWRTLALLGVLAAVPVLIGIAVRIETANGSPAGPGEGGAGPAFLSQVTNNGLFLVFASLAATLPVFLPMAVGVIAGDSVAGEANAGTLRYLLVAAVRPDPAAARQVRHHTGLLPARDPGRGGVRAGGGRAAVPRR